MMILLGMEEVGNIMIPVGDVRDPLTKEFLILMVAIDLQRKLIMSNMLLQA